MGHLVDVVDISRNSLKDTMIEATDEFQAATFTALHGFYRQSISCARSALELVAIGSACEACDLSEVFTSWQEGETKIGISWACDRLASLQRMQPLRRHLLSLAGDTLFDQRTPDHSEGWIRSLYGELSNYGHCRPGFGNGDLWNSNGPVYAAPAFRLCCAIICATYAGCYIMAKIANPNLRLPNDAITMLFAMNTGWSPPKTAVIAARGLGLTDHPLERD